ncbi:hypothetical protein ACFQV2_34235 [Actinokineospora soli]|uniref:Transposase n=1 Tax=Actinokineospora soli TaxID=1048753 RepID=A0ABW2TV18_9PSEU
MGPLRRARRPGRVRGRRGRPRRVAPAGAPHIKVEVDTYRFTMHMVDRDTHTDRQRQEVKGMRSPRAARTWS